MIQICIFTEKLPSSIQCCITQESSFEFICIWLSSQICMSWLLNLMRGCRSHGTHHPKRFSKILTDSQRFSKILQDSPRFSREGKQTGIYIKCRSGVHRTLKRRVSSKIGKDSSSAFMTTVANSHFMVIRRRSQKQLQLRYGLENGKKNNCNIKVEDHN